VIQMRRDPEIYEKRGGWFRARWHFSFDEYSDPEWTSFGSLRVFNDDRLVPGAAWPMHPHRDIEGLTYVVEGMFRHADDLGRDEELQVLPAGSVQRMTLGSGAWHSEQNASETEPMRFIQMWIVPSERGLPPSLEQKEFTQADRTDRLLEAVSPDGGGPVKVHRDAWVFVSRLNAGAEIDHPFRDRTRGAYLYVISGDVAVNDERLGTGDAAKIGDEGALRCRANDVTELILVDVPLER